MWQEAWALARHDLRRAKWNYVVITSLSLLLGAWTALALRSFQGDYALDYYLLDIYFIAVVPVIGCPWYSGRYTERTRQQLQFYRTLPISMTGMIGSRVLLVVLRSVPNALLMFGTLYLLSPNLRDTLSPLQYLWFTLIWFGYGVALSGWYPYWEMISGSKLKFWLSSVWFLVLWVALYLFCWLVLQVQILSTVIEGAQSRGWLYALLSLGVGALALRFWYWLAKSYLVKKALF